MAPSGTYVRSTMYDVRFPNSRALRGGAEQERAECNETVHGRWRLAAPMYDVRGTIAIFARVARGERSWSERNVMKLCTGGDA